MGEIQNLSLKFSNVHKKSESVTVDEQKSWEKRAGAHGIITGQRHQSTKTIQPT